MCVNFSNLLQIFHIFVCNFSPDFLTDECIENLKRGVLGLLANETSSIFSVESIGLKLQFTIHTFFLEQPFYGNYSKIDSHTNAGFLTRLPTRQDRVENPTRRAFQIAFHLDWQMGNAILNRPIITCIQILVHKWVPRTRIFALFRRRT